MEFGFSFPIFGNIGQFRICPSDLGEAYCIERNIYDFKEKKAYSQNLLKCCNNLYTITKVLQIAQTINFYKCVRTLDVSSSQRLHKC